MGVLPLVVLATLATVIASQALISGAFSLTMQSVQFGYSPRLRIQHTSPTEVGQIYVPAVNWALMVACIGLVLGFRSSTNLAAAYGVAVTTTMVITTLLFYVVLRQRFGWSWASAVGLCVPFLAIDLAFFGANLFKIPAGGWFPLVAGGLVFSIMTTWRTGRAIVAERIRGGEVPMHTFLDSLFASDEPPARVEGTAVFLFSVPDVVPPPYWPTSVTTTCCTRPSSSSPSPPTRRRECFPSAGPTCGITAMVSIASCCTTASWNSRTCPRGLQKVPPVDSASFARRRRTSSVLSRSWSPSARGWRYGENDFSPSSTATPRPPPPTSA